MIWPLILVTKLIMMGFRAPDRATTSLTLLLSANVMKTSAGLLHLKDRVYPSNDMPLTAVYYVKGAGGDKETYATMMPGAGTGVYGSTLTQWKTHVYMGNAPQRLFTDHQTTQFLHVISDLQIYAFHPRGEPITVMHQKKTLLILTNVLGQSGTHPGSTISGMLDAGEHTPGTQITYPWSAHIPQHSPVKEVVIKVTFKDKSTRELTFQRDEHVELPRAFEWHRFQVLSYVNSDGSRTELQNPTSLQ